MKGELAAYMAAAEDRSQDTDVCEWWKRHDGEIPSWAKACKLILLIQPSSAAVERAFSLLENSFSKRQEHSLFHSLSCFSTTESTDFSFTKYDCFYCVCGIVGNNG